MKPQLPISALLLCTVSFVLNHTFAQEIAMHKPAVSTSFSLKEIKETSTSLTAMKGYYLNNINMSAKRDFINKYKEVSNASWCETEGGYIAKFTTDEATTTVTYQKNGKWLYTICSYDEKKMPKDVRAIVKSTYYDYNIVNIQQIRVPQNDNDIFLIKVQDNESIKVLRVCEGEMQVLYDYIRG